MERVLSLVGLAALVGLAWVISTNRRAVRWRPVLWGLALQMGIGAFVLLPGVGEALFDGVDAGVKTLLSYSEAGSDFLFQTVEAHQVTTVAPDGTESTKTVVGTISPPLKTLAFWVLPTVVFFSALMALLYHFGVMQRLVRGVAWAMQRTMRVSGAESLSVAANIFVGQTEAPLVVRPFVDRMTLSELHTVMVAGFATVAGGVMALYVSILNDVPGIAGHLVVASLMSAPAAIAISKVMLPETQTPVTLGDGADEAIRHAMDATADSEGEGDGHDRAVNSIDALARGTLEGLQLALNIGAMLFVFVAMVALANAILGGLGGMVGQEWSMQGLLGVFFAPFAWLMGVPWEEAGTVGTLLGEKLVLTEFVAFLHLGDIQAGKDAALPALTDRSAVITSYALCGFANFASIGIQIGGIGGIAPDRRGDLARLGLRAMIGGTLAAMMTGTVAGLLYPG